MNLITDPWIPVRLPNGSHSLFSLEALFQQAESIADLDVNPIERISLIRLLVCILQAAIGAPADSYSWDDFGENLEQDISLYLHRSDIFPHFELFGPGPRFLQVKVPVTDKPVPTSKLLPHFATGNNSTLFDHYGGTIREFPPHILALALLTFQNYYPPYGAGHKGRGPCSAGNMIHTILVGNDLRQTILLNSLDLETIQSCASQIGRPIWELEPTDEKSATLSYLGRLCPRHRNIWLTENGTEFHINKKSFLYPNYPDGVREPSSTIILKKKGEETAVLSARLNRAIWRDLNLITTLRRADQDFTSAPLIFQSHQDALQEKNITFWSGALITDLKAKIFDTTESTFTVPHSLFDEVGQELYQLGIQHAEIWETALFYATSTYTKTLNIQPSKGSKKQNSYVIQAKTHYWNFLDLHRQILIEIVAQPTLLGTASFGHADDPWSRITRTAAFAAYAHACPDTAASPRLIQAYANGLRRLHLPKSKTKKTATKKSTLTTSASNLLF